MEIQEEIHHFACWEGRGKREQTFCEQNCVDKGVFPKSGGVELMQVLDGSFSFP